MHRLPKIANDVVRILFESPCAGCGDLLDTPLLCAICDNCRSRIEAITPPFCQICGDELAGSAALTDQCDRCTTTPPSFSIARSAGRFDGPLREIIHAFKFEGRRLLAEPLGTLLPAAGRDVLAGAHAVVPVPLHPLRSFRRGFNQADDLARQLTLPVWRVLRRRRQGPPQATLTASARRNNLAQHYGPSLVTHLPRPFRRHLAGAILVLIDDVMTTGATLDGCARVLREAGAGDVRALTVARTVVARPPRRAAPLHPSPLRH